MVIEIRQWCERKTLTGTEHKEVICANGNALYFVLDEVNKGVCLQMSKSPPWEGPASGNSRPLLPDHSTTLITVNSGKNGKSNFMKALDRAGLSQTDIGRGSDA